MSARLQRELCNEARHACGSAARPRRSTYTTWSSASSLRPSSSSAFECHLLPSANFGCASAKGSAARFLRGTRIVGAAGSLSRARAARRTWWSPLRRSSRCAGSFNHRDAPLGCGSGIYVTPPTTRERPTASSSGTFPQKRSIARPPRRRTICGRRSASS
jgi:hypothetical protein